MATLAESLALAESQLMDGAVMRVGERRARAAALTRRRPSVRSLVSRLPCSRQLSFLAVGAACFALQLGALVVLLRLGVHGELANAASFLLGAEVKFALCEQLVWRDRAGAGRLLRRFAVFNLTTVVIFFADVAVFALTHRVLTALPAASLGVLIGTVASYFVSDRVIFIGSPEPSEGRVCLTPVPRLWVVVPACNEEQRLGSTLDEYRRALASDDRLVIVVNGCMDRTEAIARSAADADPRVQVLVEGRVGKGGALIAGYRFVAATALPDEVVVFADADGAVGGAEIVRFCTGLAEGELRVGSRWKEPSRQVRKQPLLRRFASRVFNRWVRSVLCLEIEDTQCAAKAVTVRSLPMLIPQLDTRGFAFDLDLILAARAAGLAIVEMPIEWCDQDGSTVTLRRAVPAMVREVVRLRRKYAWMLDRRPEATPAALPPISATRHALAAPAPGPGRIDGLEPVAKPFVAVEHASARVLSRGQKIGLSLLAAAIVAGLISSPITSLTVIVAAVTLFISAANLVKLELIRRGIGPGRPDASWTAEPPSGDDATLPAYTVLLPVYHEEAILGQLIDGILALDYPADRLDVKLLLEEDDAVTRRAVAQLDLPACFEVVVVPDDGPTGKPRACNAGLARARGTYLVIYDAEDRPEPDQLRKAVNAFAAAPPEVVCLQAKLNYFNRTQNLLTRWFTAEYSLWFDQLLPGLQAMDVAMPLGGTSNHFITAGLLELGGWDAFNVTEDAELGVRIYLAGLKTAILHSTTYEEATSRCHNWVRQRSRWIKGYMQTYLRYTRHPIAMYRRMGPKAFLMLHLFVGAATVCVLVNPFYWLMTAGWFATHYHVIHALFPRLMLYLGILGLFVGNLAFTLSAVSGAYGRRNFEDVKWALLTPCYWLLMSVAAWKALIQLCYKPFYWEKTVHGHALYAPAPATVPEG